MPRTTSPVDLALAEQASRDGYPTGPRQVERWRQVGLLPANARRYTGRGSTSTATAGAAELVRWLARNGGPGRRPFDLALLAFGEGLAVPEATVRAAFVAAVDRIGLAIEDGVPDGSSPEDIAEAAVLAGASGTLLPARVRRIDRSLAAYGLDKMPLELRELDPGPAGEPFTSRDWIYNTVVALLSGGGELTVEQLGEMARSVLPRNVAAPYAADLEHQWPDNEAERAVLLNDSGGLVLFPEGDMRQFLAQLANGLPVDELRTGWQASMQLADWADRLCADVEAEISAGSPGPSSLEWVVGAVVGVARMLLTIGLRDIGSGPSDSAVTALLLLWMRDRIQETKALMPKGEFEHLKLPGVLPPCLVPLLTEDRRHVQ